MRKFEFHGVYEGNCIRTIVRKISMGNRFSKVCPYMGYRIHVKDSKILIVSFVFSYELKIKEIGDTYYNKINKRLVFCLKY